MGYSRNRMPRTRSKLVLKAKTDAPESQMGLMSLPIELLEIIGEYLITVQPSDGTFRPTVRYGDLLSLAKANRYLYGLLHDRTLFRIDRGLSSYPRIAERCIGRRCFDGLMICLRRGAMPAPDQWWDVHYNYVGDVLATFPVDELRALHPYLDWSYAAPDGTLPAGHLTSHGGFHQEPNDGLFALLDFMHEQRISFRLSTRTQKHLLHQLIEEDKYRLARYLVRHCHADVNATDALGNTALHYVGHATYSSSHKRRFLELLAADPARDLCLSAANQTGESVLSTFLMYRTLVLELDRLGLPITEAMLRDAAANVVHSHAYWLQQSSYTAGLMKCVEQDRLLRHAIATERSEAEIQVLRDKYEQALRFSVVNDGQIEWLVFPYGWTLTMT